MTPTEAIEYMGKSGKCVKRVNELGQYFRLFRNNIICTLTQSGTCCANVIMFNDPSGFKNIYFSAEFEPINE